MFSVCGIYDSDEGEYFESAYFSGCSGKKATSTSAWYPLETIHTEKVSIGVFDSSDSSVEWWPLREFIVKVYQTGVEVDGYKPSYSHTAGSKDCMSPLDKDFFYGIFFTRKAMSDLGDIVGVSRARMLGVDILPDGLLRDIPGWMVQGDTLVLPGYVAGLHGSIVNKAVRLDAVKAIRVERPGIKLPMLHIGSVKANILPSLERLELSGDFHLKVSGFWDSQVGARCSGKMVVGDFSGLAVRCSGKKYYNGRTVPHGRKFYFEGSNGVWCLDFCDYSFKKAR